MRRITLKASAPLSMALVFLLVACGTQEQATSVSPSVPPAATSMPAAATATPRPTQALSPTVTAAPVPAGEFKYFLSDLSNPQLNPAGNVNVGHKIPYNEINYDFLMSATSEGSFDPTTGFVVSYTANADSTVWTFKVRAGVVFQNGDSASATDLKYAIDLALDPKIQYNAGAEVKSSVAKIEAPDAATVVVTLKGTNIFWPEAILSRNKPTANMSYFLPPQKYLTAVGMEEANRNPIGSGPYKFKSVVVGDRIVLEAVDKHWYYGVPRIKTVTMIAIPDTNTQVALLKSKGGDFTEVAPKDISSLKQAGLRIVPREGAYYGYQWFAAYPDVIAGYGPNPLASKIVRQALFWYGVDRKAIVDSFLNGVGVPSMDYPISPADPHAYVKQPVPAYDPAKAKVMLTQAGYPTGFEIDYWLSQAPSVYPNIEMNEAIITWWTDLGIKVNRKPYTGTALSSHWQANYQTGAYPKPTVASMSVGGNALRQVSTGGTAFQHDPAAIASVARDPEGLRLARAFSSAKSIVEYKTAGIAVQAYYHEQANTWMPYLLTSQVFAVSSQASAKWKLGIDPGFHVADMVALR